MVQIKIRKARESGRDGGRRRCLRGKEKVGERGRHRRGERERQREGEVFSWRRLHPVASQLMHRSMLAPQSLSRSRDYRTHNALGRPEASRSPTWEVQVRRKEKRGGKSWTENDIEKGWIGQRSAEQSREEDGICSLDVFTCLVYCFNIQSTQS